MGFDLENPNSNMFATTVNLNVSFLDAPCCCGVTHGAPSVATPRRRFCCDDDLATLGYDGLNAAAELRRWRQGRVHATTRELIEVIRSRRASAAIQLARGMLDALAEARRRLHVSLQLRIGLASGPVVGVIGQQRILFDLWGDTVNTASRMQSSGVAGRIHVAQSTRCLLGDAYAFEEREPVEVKGLGAMTTYLLTESVLE